MQSTYLENQDLRKQIESLLLVNKEQLSMISGVNSLLNDMKVNIFFEMSLLYYLINCFFFAKILNDTKYRKACQRYHSFKISAKI